MSTKTSKEKCCPKCVGRNGGECIFYHCKCHTSVASDKKEAKQVGEKPLDIAEKGARMGKDWFSKMVANDKPSQPVEQEYKCEPCLDKGCYICKVEDSAEKVATSEKEICKCGCTKGKLKADCANKGCFECFPTPNESEDWELKRCLKYCREYNGRPDCKNCGLDEEMIDKALAKSYQRGREEVYNKRYEQGLIDGKRVYVQEFIALAVQEIGKEKETTIENLKAVEAEADPKYILGLDKAKEIISGLMKK